MLCVSGCSGSSRSSVMTTLEPSTTVFVPVVVSLVTVTLPSSETVNSISVTTL